MERNANLDQKDSSGTQHGLLGEGRFALGVTSGLISTLAILFFISPSEASKNFLENPELITSFVALFVAFSSLLISYNSLIEQRRMRQAGTDPVVLVHLGSREDAPILSTLEISNVGAGAAKDVSVELETKLSETDLSRLVFDPRKIRYPIKVIPHGHSISYNFGLGNRLLSSEKDQTDALPPLTFLVSYKDIEGTEHSEKQIVDVRELTQQRADTPSLPKIERHLEKLTKNMARLVTHDGHVNVVSQSLRDYRRKKAEELEELRQMKSDKQEGPL